jgi:hypothetical protein
MSQIITAIVVTDHRTLYFGVYYSAEIFRPAIFCYRKVKMATFNGFMQQNMSTFECSSAGWHDIEVQA